MPASMRLGNDYGDLAKPTTHWETKSSVSSGLPYYLCGAGEEVRDARSEQTVDNHTALAAILNNPVRPQNRKVFRDRRLIRADEAREFSRATLTSTQTINDHQSRLVGQGFQDTSLATEHIPTCSARQLHPSTLWPCCQPFNTFFWIPQHGEG